MTSISNGVLLVKGYDSVNRPSGVYDKVKKLVKTRADLGFKTVTNFVSDAVRRRTEEIERLTNLIAQLEENV